MLFTLAATLPYATGSIKKEITILYWDKQNQKHTAHAILVYIQNISGVLVSAEINLSIDRFLVKF